MSGNRLPLSSSITLTMQADKSLTQWRDWAEWRELFARVPNKLTITVLTNGKYASLGKDALQGLVGEFQINASPFVITEVVRRGPEGNVLAVKLKQENDATIKLHETLKDKDNTRPYELALVLAFAKQKITDSCLAKLAFLKGKKMYAASCDVNHRYNDDQIETVSVVRYPAVNMKGSADEKKTEMQTAVACVLKCKASEKLLSWFEDTRMSRQVKYISKVYENRNLLDVKMLLNLRYANSHVLNQESLKTKLNQLVAECLKDAEIQTKMEKNKEGNLVLKLGGDGLAIFQEKLGALLRWFGIQFENARLEVTIGSPVYTVVERSIDGPSSYGRSAYHSYDSDDSDNDVDDWGDWDDWNGEWLSPPKVKEESVTPCYSGSFLKPLSVVFLDRNGNQMLTYQPSLFTSQEFRKDEAARKDEAVQLTRLLILS